MLITKLPLPSYHNYSLQHTWWQRDWPLPEDMCLRMGSRTSCGGWGTSWGNHRSPLAQCSALWSRCARLLVSALCSAFLICFQWSCPKHSALFIGRPHWCFFSPSRPQTMLVSWDIAPLLRNISRKSGTCRELSQHAVRLCVTRCGCSLWGHMDFRQSLGQSMGIGYWDQNWAQSTLNYRSESVRDTHSVLGSCLLLVLGNWLVNLARFTSDCIL